MSIFGQDLRYAFRQLRRSPGFTTMALLTLVVGVGATSAIFSVADAVVLSPLPHPEPDRLVRIQEATPRGDPFSVADANYLDFRERNRTFSEMAAYREASVALTGDGQPERLAGLAAAHTIFELIGATPALGRTYTAAEDAPGGSTDVAVLSHSLWQRRFGADPTVVGRTLMLDGRRHTVLGVMRPDLDFAGAEIWLPLAADPHGDRTDHWLRVIGRLRPGATLDEAHADLAAIATGIGERHPEIAGWGVRLSRYSDAVVPAEFRQTVFVLLAAVGFLLLMGCANLASLLFARANARQTELGIRAALGAGRGRLARQLLTESLVLALIGGSLGLFPAVWAIDLLKLLEPASVPRLAEIGIGARTVAFTFGIAIAASIAFGLAPALRGSNVNVRALNGGARSGSSRGHRRVRDALVVSQFAIALVLLVGAGLMIRSLAGLLAIDPGFSAEHVVSVPLQLPEAEYAEPWRRGVFYEEVTALLEDLPGVTAVGATVVDPFGGWNLMNDVTPESRAAEVGSAGYLQAAWRSVTPGFFAAMGTPLLRGRLFSESDPYDGPALVVVTETLADRLWPGEDPIGQRLYWGGVDGTPRTVIGVVGDYRDVRLDAEPAPVMFLPHSQLPLPGMTLLVRSSAPAPALAASIRERIWSVDPNLPVPTVRPLEESLSGAVAGPRLRAILLGAFAVAALLLAAVGIYGVAAFNVTQRTREIGVRVALGAAPGNVRALILGHGAGLVATGIGIGLVGAWLLSRYLESLLYQVDATDPATFLAVTAVLAGVALLAAWVPARRALRVDPMVAIRAD